MISSAAVAEGHRQQQELLASPWVLVVEDDADLRGLVALAVAELTGMPVKAACDGLEALREIDAGAPPSLIVTDLMMPILDGYGLRERLRRAHPAIPVIAMSAVEARGKALTAGFDAYLVKPFELEELCAALARWVPVA